MPQKDSYSTSSSSTASSYSSEEFPNSLKPVNLPIPFPISTNIIKSTIFFPQPELFFEEILLEPKRDALSLSRLSVSFFNFSRVSEGYSVSTCWSLFFPIMDWKSNFCEPDKELCCGFILEFLILLVLIKSFWCWVFGPRRYYIPS